MPRLAVATAAAKNYLPFARVLASSLEAHHPEVPLFLGLADEIDGCFDPVREPYDLLHVSELGIPDLDSFLAQYGGRETAIAIKPYLLQALLNGGFETVVYIDVDCVVRGDLRGLFATARAHAITLVPHLLDPLDGPDRRARELNILQSGIFNGGVLGLHASPEARRFLSWWQARVYGNCRHAVDEGLHYDQRWLDLVPAYFSDVCVLRDPTVNVAHWNLLERDLGSARLIHFSGFDPDRPGTVTRYSSRLGMTELDEASQLFALYHRALLEAGWEEAKTWPHTIGPSLELV